MRTYIPIGGTRDALIGRWWMQDSPFSRWMAEQGFEHRRPAAPFWSTATAGIIWGDKHLTWLDGARRLADYLRTIPLEERRLIALSHGGQVAALAVSRHGVPLHSLITVATPVRKDLEADYALAAARIGQWTHVYASDWWRDWTQLGGSLFDRGVRFFRRRMKLEPILDIGVSGVGHSDLVRKPAHFEKWIAAGLLARL